MFGDFSMQAIYANGQSGAKMKELLEDYTSFIHFRLTLNCRNTKPICEESKLSPDLKLLMGFGQR